MRFQTTSDPFNGKSVVTELAESTRKCSVSDQADVHMPMPASGNVVRLFEEQAVRHADSVALIAGEQQLTYRELNERANRLAHYLTFRGVQSGTFVGICLRRSVEMIITLLGILKAGGAYVPLDPDYPSERLAFMLDDVRAPLVVTDTSCMLALTKSRVEVMRLDSDAETIASQSIDNPEIIVAPDDLVYIMYTSGSTGRPKGVMIEHRGVVRLVRDTDYAKFDSSERFLQMAPVSFDASTLEIWAPLLNGGSLVLMRPGPPSLEELGATIRQHHVTSIWLPTGLFNLMVDQHPEALLPLHQLLTGGDAGSVRHFRKALEKLPDVRLINGYGPTEATTFAVCLTVRPEHLNGSSVPIGYPIANTDVWILDPILNPVSSGETGEIYIGGPGVARGYLNRPELTAERFVVPPWASTRSARLYRTGDLARRREDETIEYLGRGDEQVKVSGYRVELGELVAALREHPAVRDAIAIAEQDSTNQKRLIAYVVPRCQPAPHSQELREFMKRKVPLFMVPAEFVTLDQIPLTPNGKADRRALPRRATKALLPQSCADTDLAENIARVWRKVLRIDAVAPDDNFFDLGGNSLLLISVHSKVQTLVGRKFPVTELFEFPTVVSLARRLSSTGSTPAPIEDAQARARRQFEMLTRRSRTPRTA
jgi:amino acid adenylation domain-containing protein